MVKESPGKSDREEYAQALTRTDDDEWMGKQMLRSAIGTENFMRQLKMEGGRHRRKRGKPAKVCEY